MPIVVDAHWRAELAQSPLMLRRSILAVLFLAIVSQLAAGPEGKCTMNRKECERRIREMLSGRKYLGVHIEEKKGSLFIKSIVPDSPASRAGLRAGDRVLLLNGYDLSDSTVQKFKEILGNARDSGRLSIIVVREGRLQRVAARLMEMSRGQIDKIVATHFKEAHSESSAGN